MRVSGDNNAFYSIAGPTARARGIRRSHDAHRRGRIRHGVRRHVRVQRRRGDRRRRRIRVLRVRQAQQVSAFLFVCLVVIRRVTTADRNSLTCCSARVKKCFLVI